jgi:hypothetical protein
MFITKLGKTLSGLAAFLMSFFLRLSEVEGGDAKPGNVG